MTNESNIIKELDSQVEPEFLTLIRNSKKRFPNGEILKYPKLKEIRKSLK